MQDARQDCKGLSVFNVDSHACSPAVPKEYSAHVLGEKVQTGPPGNPHGRS